MYECCVEGMKFEEFFDGEVAHTIAGMMHVYFIPLQHNLLTAGVAPICCAKGHWLKLLPYQHTGSLYN